jgi:DHA1 family tetracycline resistance protein-like MFS transporter
LDVSDNTATAPKSSIYPILAINFVGTLGFSIVLPFLVFLVTRWGGNALIYGLMGVTYSAFQLIGAPILGRWSDRVGRRRILLLSQLGTLVSWMLFVFAFFVAQDAVPGGHAAMIGTVGLTAPLVILFLARALDGLTGGNVSVANAYLADITPEEQRNANFGKMAVAGNLGFVIGPAIAGVLGGTSMGELLPVLAALSISVVASLLIGFGLKDTRCTGLNRDPEQPNVRKVFGQETKECFEMPRAEKLSFADAVKRPCVGRLLLIYFLVMLGFNFFYVSFPLHAVHSLCWEVGDTAAFFAFLSLMLVLVQGPVLSRLSKSVSESVLIPVGSVILSLSFLCFLSHDQVWIYAGAALLALGNGLMWPSVVSVLSKVSGSRYQGAIQGMASSAGAVASICGMLMGGLLYGVIHERVFIIVTLTILLVFFFTFRLPAKPEGSGVLSGAPQQA